MSKRLDLSFSRANNPRVRPRIQSTKATRQSAKTNALGAWRPRAILERAPKWTKRKKTGDNDINTGVTGTNQPLAWDCVQTEERESSMQERRDDGSSDSNELIDDDGSRISIDTKCRAPLSVFDATIQTEVTDGTDHSAWEYCTNASDTVSEFTDWDDFTITSDAEDVPIRKESECGCNDTVHDTLMSVGGSVNKYMALSYMLVGP